MNRPLFARPYAMALLAVSFCAAVGCGNLAELALEGTFEEVGAKMEDEAPEESIREMFRQADAACPRRMDAYTTLESVKMIDDRNVEFRYKVNNEGKTMIRDFGKDMLRNAAVRMMKGNKMAVAIAQRELSVEHIYQDAFGGRILSYTINKQVLEGNSPAASEPQANPFDARPVSLNATSADVDTDGQESGSNNQGHAQAGEDASETPLPAEVNKAKTPPPLPQAFRPKRRSPDNPAGVQANPFFTQ